MHGREFLTDFIGSPSLGGADPACVVELGRIPLPLGVHPTVGLLLIVTTEQVLVCVSGIPVSVPPCLWVRFLRPCHEKSTRILR